MFTNRFFTVLVILTLAAVIALTVRGAIATPAVASNADAARWEAMGKYYENQADAQRKEAMAEYYQSLKEAPPYIMDSATRSYIARGLALEAAGKLGNSGACSSAAQENIFAGIDSNLDSATRSYIAWGLALQAKDDLCH